MPLITTDDGCRINVEVSGSERAPALMLSSSVGTNLHMWDDQAEDFARHFRVIRYDRRGHGGSDAPPGPYSMERLGRDALSVLDALEVRSVLWCGLSIGGMVGQWLGANAPERFDKLILANTNAFYEDKKTWDDRIRFLRDNPLDKLLDATMGRWFTPSFRESAPQAIARMKDIFLTTDKAGYVACCQAIRDMDFRTSNQSITTPTLVIVGAQDAATPPAQGEAIARQIKGAKVFSIDAAHISNVEQPAAFTKAVLDFLKS
ncbi:MAG: 3-oxoadipate enol-lactonase [Proteobacteria bacterium]|nr:3-oxoadipate enol-lactonase [Pseudomonadota bacterium]